MCCFQSDGKQKVFGGTLPLAPSADRFRWFCTCCAEEEGKKLYGFSNASRVQICLDGRKENLVNGSLFVSRGADMLLPVGSLGLLTI